MSRLVVSGLALAATLAALSTAQARPPRHPPVRPDLADAAAGEYDGDVISDARGESRAGVHISVTRTGPNTVQVRSDYSRLPTFTTKLTRAMQTIQNTGQGGAGGNVVFLLDLSKSPRGLDVTVDDASWSGARTR